MFSLKHDLIENFPSVLRDTVPDFNLDAIKKFSWIGVKSKVFPIKITRWRGSGVIGSENVSDL